VSDEVLLQDVPGWRNNAIGGIYTTAASSIAGEAKTSKLRVLPRDYDGGRAVVVTFTFTPIVCQQAIPCSVASPALPTHIAQWHNVCFLSLLPSVTEGPPLRDPNVPDDICVQML
jgi:hypothetical protein